MPLVDFRARLAETVPQRLFVFVGDRSDLAPLLVQFLQFVESRDDGSFQYERIGFLAKLQLGLVVLLQVQIAQFLVDLDEIVEILYVHVVRFPQVFQVGLGHGARLLPATLQLAEGIERMVERFVAVDQFFELLDDLQLGPVIGFFLLVQTGHVLVPLAAVLGEQLLEALLGRVRRRYELLDQAARLDELPAQLFRLAPVYFVKGYLDRLRVVAYDLYRLGREQRFECRQEFLFRFARIVAGFFFQVGALLLAGFAQIEFGSARGQCGVLVREVDSFRGSIRVRLRIARLCGFGLLFGSSRVRPFFVSGFSARRRILGRLFFIGDLGGCRGGLRHIFNAGGIDLFHGNRRIFLVGVHRFAVYC